MIVEGIMDVLFLFSMDSFTFFNKKTEEKKWCLRQILDKTKMIRGNLLLVVFSALLAIISASSSCSDTGIITKETQLDAPIVDIYYACDDRKTIFALTEQRTVWRSNNEGRDWSLQMEKLLGSSDDQDVFGNGIAKIIPSTADRNRLFFQGVGKFQWTTTDCGASYQKLPSDKIWTDVLLHPTNKNIILASAFSEKCYGQTEEGFCNRQLFISKDFGQNFHKKVDFVQGYQFGAGAEAVVYGTYAQANNHQPLLEQRDASLMYTRNFWKTTHEALKNVVGFKVIEGRVYAATQDNEGKLDLFMSADDGKKIDKLQFPTSLTHQRYVIVSDGAGGILIGVLHENDYGILYASNGNSPDMVVVLRDVPMSSSAHLDLVSAEDGALLFANVLEKGRAGEGSSARRTVVSFDRGANWNAIPAPVNMPCKESKGCSLHLHTGHKAILSQHRETDSQQGIILTKKQAGGFVLAVGNIGPNLDENPDAAFTLMSRDGGGSFSRILSGTHAVDMGGHGAVVAAVKNYRHTSHLHYNAEQTTNFKTCAFSENEINVADIVTEPNGTSINFLIYGKKKEGGDAVIVHVDFHQLLPTTCRGIDAAGNDDSDFEYFTLADGTARGCLNGEHTMFTRRKPSVPCVPAADYVRRSIVQPCKCVEEDYECNFCYERQKETLEIALPNAPLPSSDASFKCTWSCKGQPPSPPQPPANCHETYTIPTEYRKIAGNRCVGGKILDKKIVACPGYEGPLPADASSQGGGKSSSPADSAQAAVEVKVEVSSGSPTPQSGIVDHAVSEEAKSAANNDKNDNPDSSEEPRTSSAKAGYAVGTLVVIAIIAVIAFFVYTNKSNLGGGWSLNVLGRNQYSYSRLAHRLDPDDMLDDDDDDDDPSSLENAALASIGRTKGGLDCRVLG